ncbi:MAG: hypothetical protein JOZ10_09500 [Acidobacteria bacterium]|nr:hypothetical protein [Acidobacteriota bacterium]MBV9144439.1 hypothetical protein [Acidobacteriota bacterium]MBV9437158.1 hypothetical protein [Acidobacteriota bacterium]
MRTRIASIVVAGVVFSLLLTQTIFPSHKLDIVPTAYADDDRGAPSAQDHDESAVCSVATLNGSYGFFRTGATAVGPLAAVGIVTFDGNGASAARQTIRKNGVTTSDLFVNPPAEGPYEVDADCAARFLNPDGSVISHAVIVDGGNELFILSLSNGNSVYGVMKKIGKHQH